MYCEPSLWSSEALLPKNILYFKVSARLIRALSIDSPCSQRIVRGIVISTPFAFNYTSHFCHFF